MTPDTYDDITARHLIAHSDETSTRTLDARGLTMRRVPHESAEQVARWRQVVARGFLDPELTPERLEAGHERMRARRLVGVFDPASPDPDQPVASVASWMTELSIPGGRTIPASAISAVTVAPTHRRRGIARAMLEGDLRTAREVGAPIAVLTVSESTLYGRYGFAPAANAASWRIDVKRAQWTGPHAPGRLDFIPRERFRELSGPLHDRARLAWPGEITMPHGHWDVMAGTTAEAENPGRKRAVQYTAPGGEVTGLALYSVEENPADDTASVVTLHMLLSADDEAYAALWRFFIELDLIGEVRADQRAVDEPLWWMISDKRAATITVTDHQYVRIIDIEAALQARRFGAAGTVALDVHDPVGLGGGRFLLRADEDGWGSVTPWTGEDAPAGAVAVRLGVEELSAVYLGGVSLSTLAAAGRVQSTDAAAAASVFAWPITPRLSFWY